MAWLKSSSIEAIARILEDYSSAALTVATTKKEWIVTHHGRIGGVRINASGAAGGAGTSTIDININGVTIFTTQANRPQLAVQAGGDFTVGPPDVGYVKPGDVVSYDVDTIPAVSGHTRVEIAISLVRP